MCQRCAAELTDGLTLKRLVFAGLVADAAAAGFDVMAILDPPPQAPATLHAAIAALKGADAVLTPDLRHCISHVLVEIKHATKMFLSAQNTPSSEVELPGSGPA